jgi:hypothetical protein
MMTGAAAFGVHQKGLEGLELVLLSGVPLNITYAIAKVGCFQWGCCNWHVCFRIGRYVPLPLAEAALAAGSWSLCTALCWTGVPLLLIGTAGFVSHGLARVVNKIGIGY